jgi:hypothetical protein
VKERTTCRAAPPGLRGNAFAHKVRVCITVRSRGRKSVGRGCDSDGGR